MAPSLWKGLVGVGLFALAHAAFSAAQHRSYMRLTEKEDESLPIDVFMLYHKHVGQKTVNKSEFSSTMWVPMEKKKNLRSSGLVASVLTLSVIPLAQYFLLKMKFKPFHQDGTKSEEGSSSCPSQSRSQRS
ncbi:ER membrane protein complex subunit 5 isoform X2 [Meriones unguiculatus]|uniref:ER membrane protein complex subunit 5 isoform X2 n=1 Tax=Meriones unguiculatus TaxID=10047 RepID=UPI00293EA8CA|nr:ER membrane protein complex subunit 5 isoform X2 [Meriones unguiculatus]